MEIAADTKYHLIETRKPSSTFAATASAKLAKVSDKRTPNFVILAKNVYASNVAVDLLKLGMVNCASNASADKRKLVGTPTVRALPDLIWHHAPFTTSAKFAHVEDVET